MYILGIKFDHESTQKRESGMYSVNKGQLALTSFEWTRTPLTLTSSEPTGTPPPAAAPVYTVKIHTLNNWNNLYLPGLV